MPVADIAVLQNERLLSKAERNSLKKFSSICMFFLSCVFEGFSSIPSDFTLCFPKKLEGHSGKTCCRIELLNTSLG